MKSVWVVEHVHEFPDGREDVKFIGVYSSNKIAEQAVKRLLLQPGFEECPEGFHVTKYEIDKDHWTEGYVTV